MDRGQAHRTQLSFSTGNSKLRWRYKPQVQAVHFILQHPIQLAVQSASAGSTCCFAAPHSIGGTKRKCRQYISFCSTSIQLAVQITSAGSTCFFAAPHSIGGTNHKCRQYNFFCSTPFNWRYKAQVQAVHVFLQHPIQLAVQSASAGSTCIFAAPHSIGSTNHKRRQYMLFCSTSIQLAVQITSAGSTCCFAAPLQFALHTTSAGSTCFCAAPHSIGGTNHKCRQYMLFCSTPFNWRYKSQVQAVHVVLQHPIQLAVQTTSTGSTCCFAAPHSIGGINNKCRQYMLLCSIPFNWRYKSQVQAVHVFLQHPIQLAVQSASAGSTCFFCCRTQFKQPCLSHSKTDATNAHIRTTHTCGCAYGLACCKLQHGHDLLDVGFDFRILHAKMVCVCVCMYVHYILMNIIHYMQAVITPLTKSKGKRHCCQNTYIGLAMTVYIHRI